MGTTPNYLWPYPELTDPPDGPGQIEALANAADATVKAVNDYAIGINARVPVAFTANEAAVTAPAQGAGSSVSVSFPVGRFTQVPVVVASTQSNGYGTATTGVPQTTGVTIRYYNPATGTPTGTRVSWIAIQMSAGAGPGFLAASSSEQTKECTCHTAGCGNAGITIPLPYDDDATTFMCGVCAQPIEDISG
jgi:hypothetical protein